MSLFCIDIGGTSTKFAICQQEKLSHQESRPSPKNLADFYNLLEDMLSIYKEKHHFSGIAISTPGAVNQKTGVIEGASALPYLHHFPIKKELEKRLGYLISLENDANCAALAESYYGAGRDCHSFIQLVLGTGVGGSIVLDGKLHTGAHLFGGEFGYMVMNERFEIFSQLGTVVNMANRYNHQQQPETQYSGQEVLALAENGDLIAQKERKTFLRTLAMGIFNLQHAFDPEKILIGGGVSQAPFLLPSLQEELKAIYEKVEISDLHPQIAICHFKNEANLIGAGVYFQQEHNMEFIK